MDIKISRLKSVVRAALLTKYSKEEVDLITPIVMFGELSGRKSHGIIRLLVGEISYLNLHLADKPRIIKKTSVSSIIEGKGNPGMLVGNMVCEEAIKIAKKKGIGIVGSRGSVGSSGSLSYYCEKIARKDLIGIILARAPGDVAPYGGLERIFGTNPVAFGIPRVGTPLIFDMATSAISFGEVVRLKTLGKELPKGVAVDRKGKLTRDPNKALEGAFLTFDNSYKGAGLAMMVEILAGVLTGADFADMGIGDEWGNLFIVIKPELLSDLKQFKKRVRLLVERVRNSKTKSGKKVRISGERTIQTRDQVLKKGIVKVDDNLFKQLEEYNKAIK